MVWTLSSLNLMLDELKPGEGRGKGSYRKTTWAPTTLRLVCCHLTLFLFYKKTAGDWRTNCWTVSRLPLSWAGSFALWEAIVERFKWESWQVEAANVFAGTQNGSINPVLCRPLFVQYPECSPSGVSIFLKYPTQVRCAENLQIIKN